MKKIIIGFSILITLVFAQGAFGAPTTTFQRNLFPELTNTYELGTSTLAWKRLTTNEICLTGDCKVAWPSGGAGTVGPGVVDGLAFFTTTSTITSNSNVKYSSSTGIVYITPTRPSNPTLARTWIGETGFSDFLTSEKTAARIHVSSTDANVIGADVSVRSNLTAATAKNIIGVNGATYLYNNFNYNAEVDGGNFYINKTGSGIASALYGVWGGVGESSTGTTNFAAGVVGSFFAGGGTTDEAAGLYAQQFGSTAGTIIKAEALRVDNPDVGTTQWGIANHATQNYHMGKTKFGDWTIPAYTVDVSGTLAVSATSTFQNVVITGTCTGCGSGITSINTDATAAQTLSVGTSGTDFAISNNGTGGHTFNLPTASASNRGALSTTDWSTFNSKIGGSGSTNGIAYFTGASTLASTSSLTWDGATLYSKGNIQFLQNNLSSGSPTAFSLTGGTLTTLTTSTEDISVLFDLSANKQWKTGNFTTQRDYVIKSPTYSAVGATTIQQSGTFVIDGAPKSGTNVTQGISSALWVQNFDGDGTIGSFALRFDQPNIANGIGDTDALGGLGVLPLGITYLGNQTATTSIVTNAYFANSIYDTNANRRSVYDGSTIYVGGTPESNSSNVPFITGSWGLDITGRNNGFYNNGTNVTQAVHVEDYTVLLQNSTRTTARDMATVGLGQATFGPGGASSSTIDYASTLYVKGAPIATTGGGGTAITITDKYAIFSDAGLNRFDGDGTYVFELPADATGNVSAAVGRIPIKVGGALKYLRYYND